MSAEQNLTAKEGFPAFSGEPHYIDGYHPSSYDSPHTSLTKSSTWIGMGLILATVIGLGTVMFGLGSHLEGSQANGMGYAIFGAVWIVACLVIGTALIHHGRRDYRAYVAATGRK